MIIVGIAGKKYSGKDSFYQALARVSKLPVIRVALGDALKDEVYEHVLKPNNIPREALDNENKVHFRLILQGWGTDFRRNLCGSDYWVQRLDTKIQALREANFQGIVAITDVRFEDEAEYVRKAQGYLVRIHRFKKPWWKKSLEDSHPSECALDNYSYDHHVYNYKSIEDLETAAKEFLNLITPKITHAPYKINNS